MQKSAENIVLVMFIDLFIKSVTFKIAQYRYSIKKPITNY